VAKTSLDPEKHPTRSQRYDNSVAIWLQNQMPVRQTPSIGYDGSSANFMTPIWFVTVDSLRLCAVCTARNAMRSSKWLVFIRPSLAGFDRPLTLLCYEKSSSFCHRHIAARWL
jgi:hypothetical protein